MAGENIFKFALVGTGNISQTYLKSIVNVDGAEISGVVSRSLEKADDFIKANQLDAVPADSISSLKCDFDAVILALPNGLHHKAALEAASLGKHVFTEKSLDISIPAMDSMIDECAKNNVKLAVAYQRRVSPDNISVKKLIEENKLGRIFAADLTVKFYRPQSYYDSAPYRGTMDIDGGGPFMQQASHNIDIYCWFFGMPEKTVSMLDTFTHDVECEDHGAALLRYRNGMIGTVIASTSTKPGFNGKLEIHSEKGSIILENDSITHWSIEGIDNPAVQKNDNIHDGSSVAVNETSAHQFLLKDFIQAVRDDRTPYVCGKSAREATELILKIYESNLI